MPITSSAYATSQMGKVRNWKKCQFNMNSWKNNTLADSRVRDKSTVAIIVREYIRWAFSTSHHSLFSREIVYLLSRLVKYGTSLTSWNLLLQIESVNHYSPAASLCIRHCFNWLRMKVMICSQIQFVWCTHQHKAALMSAWWICLRLGRWRAAQLCSLRELNSACWNSLRDSSFVWTFYYTMNWRGQWVHRHIFSLMLFYYYYYYSTWGTFPPVIIQRVFLIPFIRWVLDMKYAYVVVLW